MHTSSQKIIPFPQKITDTDDVPSFQLPQDSPCLFLLPHCPTASVVSLYLWNIIINDCVKIKQFGRPPFCIPASAIISSGRMWTFWPGLIVKSKMTSYNPCDCSWTFLEIISWTPPFWGHYSWCSVIKMKCAQTLVTGTAKVLVREVYKTAVRGPDGSVMMWDMVSKCHQSVGSLRNMVHYKLQNYEL